MIGPCRFPPPTLHFLLLTEEAYNMCYMLMVYIHARRARRHTNTYTEEMKGRLRKCANKNNARAIFRTGLFSMSLCTTGRLPWDQFLIRFFFRAQAKDDRMQAGREEDRHYKKQSKPHPLPLLPSMGSRLSGAVVQIGHA